MDTVKSVKFNKEKKSPTSKRKFEKTPHSNKLARPEKNDMVLKKRKLNFSDANESLENGLSSPAKNSRDSKKTPEEIQASKNKNTIFIANLPGNVTHSDVTECFKEFGKVISARIRGLSLSKDAKSRKGGAIMKQIDRDYATAYVQYDTLEAAQLAVKANGVMLDERHLRIDFADPEFQRKVPAKNAIFVRNIDYEVTEDELWEVFSQCGEIESVRIVRSAAQNYAPRGMGFVNFTSSASVPLALALRESHLSLNGRELKIFPYNGKSKKEIKPNNTNTSKGGPFKSDKEKKIKKQDVSEGFTGKKAIIKKKKNKKPGAADMKKKKLAELLTK